ncbi:WD40/YVTN/BNR-like repeat-containing protein [Robiginitalea sediminis]|uniref:WD40/YVTN/BNR-like repeat-containing protein n=1 Tax=Robiginitalea sediminis TaxID=1982593 RepID=UPI0018E9AECE|nr:oxidoreductase [Robiginitalea sediminis]
MRTLLILGAVFLAFTACNRPTSHAYTRVSVHELYRDSVSIRALDLLPGALAMAGSDGFFASMDLATHKLVSRRQEYQGTFPEFRAVAHTASDFFMLSVGSPALLYKTGDQGQMELVYREEGEGVFYDAMAFWDDTDGIAVGDAMDGCLSMILTRNGGQDWEKVPCSLLPPALEGEGAFAASNTNIAIVGEHCWVVTSRARILYSPDRGKSWEVFQTPALAGSPSQGLYSLDFFDADTGFALGGDYTVPAGNTGNKVATSDGGRSWALMADGALPGYKSCVRYVPGSGGRDLVAVGFTGIDYSQDGGSTWKTLSEEGFYTLKFLNDSVAYAAGRERVARLVFKTP